ncbi:MAG: G1 family glutamic endopeptidase, partial [Candidatus Dormibacteria bacterium]
GVITTTSLPSATVGRAYSATRAASGGTAPYSWAITSGSLPSGLTLSSGGSIIGTPSAAGTASFGVQVTDSTTPTAETATTQLSISVASAATPTVQSPNWSGYIAGNGPYTAVQGTFNVPTIYASSTNTETAEWVGIDGYPPTNTSLIQAGIDEPYDASTNTYQIRAWWEILPAYPTMVLIPAVDMSVATGNSITVTIGQISGTDWGITVTDDTTGQTFTTDQTYAGPLASAEWIVEAPGLNGAIETLGGYTPDVTFSSLGITGSQTALDDCIMVQNGVQVSTPSALDATGFNVAYGDVAPPAP